MEIRVRKQQSGEDSVDESQYKLYPHDLTFYEELITEDLINLFEFQELLETRCKILMKVKAAYDKGYAPFSEDWKKCIHDSIVQDTAKMQDFLRLLFHPDHKKSPEDIRRRRKDTISHQLLLVGFCNTTEKQQWITSLELDLFRLKFQNLSAKSIKEFLKINALKFNILREEEKNQLKEDLLNASNMSSSSQLDSIDYYKVNYQQSIESLSSGDLPIIRKKMVYVPHTEVYPLLEHLFREHLNKRLKFLNTKVDRLRDTKYQPIFDKLSMAPSYEGEGGNVEISLASLNQLTKTSFPLCSRTLYEALLHFSHLKYNGRRILQLFLKGIGLPVEGCIELFRKEFLKKIDEAKFQKEYVYNIRHNYGLEGSKTKYTPLSCLNIIKTPISEGDHHGCPYKNWDPERLKRRLEEYNLGSQALMQVMDAVKAGHAQIACSRVFEFTHNGVKAAINHPNQYFDESRAVFEPARKNTTVTIKEEPVVKKEEEKQDESVNDLMLGIDASVFDTDMD